MKFLHPDTIINLWTSGVCATGLGYSESCHNIKYKECVTPLVWVYELYHRIISNNWSILDMLGRSCQSLWNCFQNQCRIRMHPYTQTLQGLGMAELIKNGAWRKQI